MLTDKQISALRTPFPPEALSADTSRGFELTSIKAAYVIERLNEVFSTCGVGWRYAHSPFEFLDGEVLTEVALQYAVPEGGTHAVVWQNAGWCFVDGSDTWSWPIFAAGGKRIGKGSAPITDARKSAVTDGLTKAASMIGVGHEVFKGHVRVGQTRQGVPERAQRSRETQESGANGKTAQNGSQGLRKAVSSPNSTTFWRLANQHKDKLDRAQVSKLAKRVQAGEIDWTEAQSLLDDLIDEATVPVIESVPTNSSGDDPLDELFV